MTVGNEKQKDKFKKKLSRTIHRQGKKEPWGKRGELLVPGREGGVLRGITEYSFEEKKGRLSETEKKVGKMIK